ncbi:MAG: hypothetical protein ACOX9R_08775 [Armatimonadota bacterium]|jgi:hypothetical protein
MRHAAVVLSLVVAFSTMLAPAHAQRELSAPGETVESARQEAVEAVRQSPVPLTISTVGFDIRPGSEAERYLQETASIGGGGYFFATDGGQLTEALGAAAAGQTIAMPTAGVAITTPRDGDRVAGRVEVAGTGRPGALIVVSSEARSQATDELLRDVPGSRHRIEDDGTWQVWVAAPTLPDNVAVPLYYIIKAKWVTRDEESPETQVKVFRAD